ncbi:MAG: 2-octaprenyl-6-methoxyphenyl hydroxylase [Kangiellaceae bacterium]|nr:2-octaprenyl-6-methoxyphenyl hydroxylase [Kangiellaceae bacterium]MCW8999853.1 2-octaprenyl-6-methoxyphenyl hydroxylase [Kangiellaceae bacterium]MCW9017784.1 2-octaprenyl-6-methoxyphenyl hydroxylase [Kangiellaceae bacterium]
MSQTAIQQFDVLISGGGMTGATAAIGLAQLGLSVAIVEAVEPELEISPSFDQRAVALSAASVEIYRSLGLWPLMQHLSCAIKKIHVSDQGQFGFTRLTAEENNVEALGEVIPLDLTGPVLWKALQNYPSISTFCPWQVELIEQKTGSEKNGQIVQLVSKSKPSKSLQFEAKLVLAADGSFSQIAQMLAIEHRRKSYNQHAVIANIQTSEGHDFRAFERFTSGGPLALLPLTGNRMSLVWCQKPEFVDTVMNWSEQEFKFELQRAFGYRLGEITKIGERFQYPLSLHLPSLQFKQNMLLMGNAAHTLHPIAGQGFNLCLRDIAVLVELVQQAITSGRDWTNQDFLEQYVDSRQVDWQQTILATDSFARLFSNEFVPLVLMRNKGMNLVNQFKPLKQLLSRGAMGYGARSSRLARGIPITIESEK